MLIRFTAAHSQTPEGGDNSHAIDRQTDQHSVVHPDSGTIYLATKRKEALTQAIAWMNLKNMLLSERSKTHKATYYMIPVI